MIIDYTDRLGCRVAREPSGSRALFKERDVFFPGISPDALREKLNEAMEYAVAHYHRNVASSGVAMEQSRIEEAALNVVLHFLRLYNLWRQHYPEHKHQPLVVGDAELEHVPAHDECLFYCEREYGANYAIYAAALLGMTSQEFLRYEEGRRRFWKMF
jgi:hypothetical protein